MMNCSYPIEDFLELKPTPTTAEVCAVYGDYSFPFTTDDWPYYPRSPDLDSDLENSEILVKGPQYGTLIARRDKNGSLEERYKFPVTDAERNQIRSKTPVRDVPQYIHAALLKSGWFCEDWGEEYTGHAADYLHTYGALLRHIKENSNPQPETKVDMLDPFFGDSSNEDLSKAKIRDGLPKTLSEAAKDVFISDLLTQDICNPELGNDLTRITDKFDFELSVAIREYIDIIESGKMDPPESIVNAERKLEEGEGLALLIEQLLAEDTCLQDRPNVCPNFIPGEDATKYWGDVTDDSEFFHFPLQQFSERYTVDKQSFEQNGERYLQVGVITAEFTFYNLFKQVGEDKYDTINTENGFPSIFCAAALRDEGKNIQNLPAPALTSLPDIYQAIHETIVRIHKKSPALHPGAVRTMVRSAKEVNSAMIAFDMKKQVVSQENLPKGATGDGMRGVIDTSEDGPGGRRSAQISALEEDAGIDT